VRAHLSYRGVAVVLALAVGALSSCGSPEGEPLPVVVPNGASLGQVTDSLAAKGIIEPRWTPFFRAWVRLKRADRQVRAGHYEFRRREVWGKVLDDLRSGRVVTVRLTIPEGFTLRQMAPRIAELAGRDPEAVGALLYSDSLAALMPVPGPGLEGYLFPETYLFEPETSVLGVVTAMVARYRAFWTEERRLRLLDLDMSERELVTLASIIQAEARRVEEMPTISSVYHNRLRQNYPLQADPTVLYALGGHRARLLYAALDSVAEHPYNTYRRPGLPPGPIAAPGEAALMAALHPADTDHFFFVARPDGSHVFTRSLSEHNVAKSRARREWDTAGSALGVRGPEVDSTAPPPPDG
jgi:UPF0755 protein